MDFSKQYEWDGAWLKEMNKMDYGLKKIKMKYDQWSW